MPTGNSDRDNRPSPEALLHTARQEERQKGGRLKVFLGAAPGVGKTYTMLEAARIRAMKGANVAVGIVETHGRSETAQLLLGLEMIPRLRVEYRGTVLEEMDLDTVLALHPQLVLVDELAHTNAPGCRHPKRYLDVEELLDAGMDVYTTLNIQHLESLNDAVAQITGVRVRETIPDRIMERADEVELVDLSVEDLLQRLREGKVYLPEQAEQAIRSYFRPGNLSALRQLALRHTAERVDEEMQSYMQAHAIPGPWPAGERLLVSVGPSPMSQRLVRATRRMAERRHADWIAVYVETPRHYRMSDADRDRVAATLRLAEELGGKAVTIPGNHISEDLVAYARSHNVTEIVVGKSHRSRWFELRHGSIVRELIRESGDIDVYIISGSHEESATDGDVAVESDRGYSHLRQYLWSTLVVTGAALLGEILKSFLSLPNLSMIFLLGVLLSAVLWGLRASIFTSILSVLVYDFFFVPPFHTFTINRPEDVLALVTFLVVAIITSNLTGRIRDEAEAAGRREARTSALYGLSREVAVAVGLSNVLHAVVMQIAQNLSASVVALLPEGDRLTVQAAHPPDTVLSESERASATWSWQKNQVVGRGSDTLPGEQWYYLPLRTAQGAIGVLALDFDPPHKMISPDQRRLLEALAHQAAIAIEHAELSRDMEQAQIIGERERLQAILLSSISHDLRTPLASILGSATSLLDDWGSYDNATRRDLLVTIRDEGERLNRFVGNILDTTRLESGALHLNREWVEIADVIGTAVSHLAQPLSTHPLELNIAPDLPLLLVDFVLIEQVFLNLLDNAAKYSAPTEPIAIRAFRDEDQVVVQVEDHGVGIPNEDLDLVFDKFYRVQHGDRQIAGTGLGLSICRGIVEEHRGTISAASPWRDGVGTAFTVRLPVEKNIPQMAGEEAPE